MKRSRLNTTTWPIADKRKAVNTVTSLVANGVRLTEARAVVASEYDVTSSCIANWEGKLRTTTKRTIARVAKPTITSSVSKDAISNVQNELNNVFISLVAKDGKFSSKEASTICQVTGSMLSAARFELEVHRYTDKLRQHDNTVENLLT